MESLWINLGKLLILQALLDTARNDWTGYGTRLWAENRIKELSSE